jgi:hypothetical protein
MSNTERLQNIVSLALVNAKLDELERSKAYIYADNSYYKTRKRALLEAQFRLMAAISGKAVTAKRFLVTLDNEEDEMVAPARFSSLLEGLQKSTRPAHNTNFLQDIFGIKFENEESVGEVNQWLKTVLTVEV